MSENVGNTIPHSDPFRCTCLNRGFSSTRTWKVGQLCAAGQQWLTVSFIPRYSELATSDRQEYWVLWPGASGASLQRMDSVKMSILFTASLFFTLVCRPAAMLNGSMSKKALWTLYRVPHAKVLETACFASKKASSLRASEHKRGVMTHQMQHRAMSSAKVTNHDRLISFLHFLHRPSLDQETCHLTSGNVSWCQHGPGVEGCTLSLPATRAPKGADVHLSNFCCQTKPASTNIGRSGSKVSGAGDVCFPQWRACSIAVL